MRKIIYILILSFGCDSLEKQFGVEESEDNFRYYDFLSYGWSYIFDNNPDLAFSYFDQSLLVEDILYYNSALVGMGWAKTYQANSILNSDQCIDNVNDCTDFVDETRNKAKCFFYKAILDESGGPVGKTSDQILEECNDVTIQNYDLLNILDHSLVDAVNYYSLACAEDEQGESEFDSCFQNFILDLKVGYLYLEYLSYVQSIIDDSIDDIETQSIIDLFVQFLTNNSDYDIMTDKSNYDSQFSLNYQNIASTISQLYISIGDYESACDYAEEYLDCLDLDCTSGDTAGDVLYLLNCLDTPIN